ncbi:FUN14 domain-containing protein [Deinococcus puniceus]|uniref:FUN14 family protein n=1 Tax=Deinococcus puniceus TaxID=1182568 RepID=A0A172T7W9_9DEIO|nr:FUN14 domain-containing protein [Deinococcus puniceus]ANE43036.1 hypothetical protein SU48_03810 [Deinococcus puniceus]
MPAPLAADPASADTALTGGLLASLLPDLSVGAVLGFATGYALKKLGRVVLLLVGLLFIALQVLSWFDLVTVHWTRVQALSEPWLRQGSEQGAAWLSRLLTANLPFAGAFTAALLVGLRARG